MRLRSILQLLAVVCTLALMGWSQTTPGEFTVISLPDTQNYSQYYPDIFMKQTQWIADHAAELNIKFVIGLGDIVNNGSDRTQYANADAAYRVLDSANIPYLAMLGNHDYKNATPSTRDTTVFNQYFGPARYAGKSYYRGGFPAGTNDNFYTTFEINGVKYVVLALEFIPRDSALQWAAGILAANMDKKAIVVTHGYLTPSGWRQGHCDGNSAESFGLTADNDAGSIWDKLLRKYPNVIMVMNGHDTGAARRQDLGQNGNLINQLVVDYQDWAMGGGGYLRIYTFKPALNQIDVKSYSPYYGTYLTDSNNQFSIPILNPGNVGTNGSINGLIRDQQSCAPLGGVTVTVNGTQTTTNSNGTYTISSIAGPTETVLATAPGKANDTQTIQVDPGKTAQLHFFMQSAGTSTGSVVVNSPANNSNVTSPVSIKATATSSVSAINTMLVYVENTLAYSTSGNTVNTAIDMTPGSHRITVQGADGNGTWYKNQVSVNVSQAASVTMTAPQNNATVTSPVQVTGSATAEDTIVAMQVYVDNQLKYQNAANTVNTSLAMSTGTHNLVLQAWDSKGGTYKTPATINVIAATGSVTMSSPANGATVSSPVNVIATATAPKGIVATQIYLDNKLVYDTPSSSTKTTLAMSKGSHLIVVKAWDSAGAAYSTSRTVNVN